MMNKQSPVKRIIFIKSNVWDWDIHISRWYYSFLFIDKNIISMSIIVVLRSDSVVIILVPTGKYPTLTLTLTCGGYCYYFPNTPWRWFPLISSDSWNISTPSLDVHIDNIAKNVCKGKGRREKMNKNPWLVMNFQYVLKIFLLFWI